MLFPDSATGIVNTAPWQPLSDAFDMLADPASVVCVSSLAATSIERPVWSVNVTPVVVQAGWPASAPS